MPKIKTHKSAAKRFSVTGTGKLMRNKAYKRHLLINKNSKVKRNLSKKVLVSKADLNNVKKMLPGI